MNIRIKESDKSIITESALHKRINGAVLKFEKVYQVMICIINEYEYTKTHH